MKKWLWITGGLFAFIIVLILLLPFLIDLDSYKDKILPQVEAALDRKVQVGHVSLDLWPGIGIRLAKLQISDHPDFSSDPFVAAEDLVLKVRLWPLLRKRVEVEALVLEQPRVELIQNTQGILNASTMGKDPAAPKSEREPTQPGSPGELLALLGVDRLEIRKGNIRYVQKEAKGKSISHEIKDLDLTLTDLGLNKTARLEASMSTPMTGRLQLTGQVGPLTEDLRPEKAMIEMKSGRSDLLIEGGAKPDHWVFRISSKEVVSDDFSGPPLSLPKGITLQDISGNIQWTDKEIRIADLKTKVFGGEIATKGRLGHLDTRMPFEAELDAKALQIGQAMDAFSSVKGVLTGIADFKGSIKGSGTQWEEIAPNLRGQGSLKIKDGNLPKGDLLEQVLRGLETVQILKSRPERLEGESVTAFSLVDGRYNIQNGKIQWDHLNLVATDFDLKAKGSIGLDQALALQGEMILSRGITQRLSQGGGFAGAVFVKEGRLSVPLRIGGTLENPKVTVDARSIVKESGKEIGKELKKKLLDRIIR